MIYRRARYFVAIFSLIFVTRAVRADVQPGDDIGPANVAQVRDLVSPGIVWCIEHGMHLKIVAPRSVPWNAAYREATEKYAGQVQLSADGRRISGYTAGLPFPTLDPNDPQIALKIMWNYEHKPFITDDLDLRNFDADTGSITENGMEVERHYLLDHLRTLFYNGRLYVDPKPEIPNKEGIRGKGSLHPILEPFDLKGTGMTTVINQYGFRDRAAPTYGITYPDAMPFNHSISMVDTQLVHATRAALPSAKFPNEEGWYFNQGEKTGLTPEFFTVAHLVASGN